MRRETEVLQALRASFAPPPMFCAQNSSEILCIYACVNEGLDSDLDPSWLKVTRGTLAWSLSDSRTQ